MSNRQGWMLGHLAAPRRAAAELETLQARALLPGRPQCAVFGARRGRHALLAVSLPNCVLYPTTTSESSIRVWLALWLSVISPATHMTRRQTCRGDNRMRACRVLT